MNFLYHGTRLISRTATERFLASSFVPRDSTQTLSSWDILSWPLFASLRLHRLTAQSQPKLEKPNALLVAGEKPSKLAVSIDFSLAFSGPASIRLHTILFAFAGFNSVGLGSILRARNRFDSSLGLDSCSLLIIGSLSGLNWTRRPRFGSCSLLKVDSLRNPA